MKPIESWTRSAALAAMLVAPGCDTAPSPAAPPRVAATTGEPTATPTATADSTGTLYVLQYDGHLASFDPETRQFTDMGALDCLSAEKATPYTMTRVDASHALVLLTNGASYRVDLKTRACTEAPSPGRSFGYHHFAMSRFGEKGTPQFLVAAGSDDELAMLDLPTSRVTPLAPLAGNPELTSDEHGTPWAFFPETPSRISRLDPITGAEVQIVDLPQLINPGQPMEWAIASTPNTMWIFLRRCGDASSRVYRLDTVSNQITPVLDDSDRKIVGAIGI